MNRFLYPAFLPLLGIILLGGCKSADKEEKTANANLSPEQSHQSMVEQLAAIAKESKSENDYFGDRHYKQLLAQVERTKDKPSPDTLLSLGLAELKLGMVTSAIGHMEQALLITKDEAESGVRKRDVLYWLGVACLRQAEAENCCAQNTPDSCIVPIKDDGIHLNREGSSQAVKYFTQVIQTTPRNSESNIRARWLLNLAAMTLGDYPEGVPAQYRVAASYFESTTKFPRFKNIAKQHGLDTFSSAGGIIVDDFDNDGDLDLVVSDSNPGVPRAVPICNIRGPLGASNTTTGGQLKYYQNKGDGNFSDQTDAANLTGLFGGLNINQADFNNDGWLDILVLRGGWFKDEGKHPNSLLRNNGDGTFTDITLRAGLAEINQPSQTASWADYDLDGDLDLYLGNERQSHDPPSQLFRNNGDETFTNVAREAGVTNDRFAKAVIWGDYDHDHYPDLYVSNFGAKNRLYHNNGDGTFTDVADKHGVSGPSVSFPCWFWDYDNDGHLDLYVSSYAAKMDDIAANAFGYQINIETAKLYKNTGSGFRDVAAKMNLISPSSPMGSNFGDLNGDGYLDFYLGTGWPEYDELMPNRMYLNRGGKKFADVTMAGGFGHLQKGHGIAFADFDQDGDQDVFEEMGGAVKGDSYFNALWKNPGFGNHWITIKLVGTKTNRSAIGARIRIDIEEGKQTRSIYRHMNSGGTFGANPLQQNIGLGQASKIKLLEVEWPVSGTTQSFSEVALDQVISITEGLDKITFLSHE
ncbi:CRTAC1 family protein [bacterium]|nr:CRTAC1 family protein [bacterium]